MQRLPRLKASKRCTQCGGGGPFGITSHRGTAYYRSECLACSRAATRQRNRRMRAQRGSALRVYHTRWQRQRRLTQRLACYADQPSRVDANYIGRHTLQPGMKWCSYGQHSLPATAAYFWAASSTHDGLMRNCKVCRSAVNKARYARQKRLTLHGPHVS